MTPASRASTAVLVIAIAVVALSPGLAGAAASESCPIPANQEAKAAGRTVKPPIVLSVLEPSPVPEVLNFDNGREPKEFPVVLMASRPLPRYVQADQFEIEDRRRPRRVSDTLESASLPSPSFSHMRISRNRKRISFTTCFNATGGAPGTYTNQITVSGPNGVSEASIGVTANLKSLSRFIWLGILAALAAFFLLLLKAATENRERNEGLGNAIGSRFKRLDFWVPTLIGLVTAAAAMLSLYAKDPAWGADLWESLTTLVGATLAATGVGSLITTFTR